MILMINDCVNSSLILLLNSKHELTTALNEDSEQLEFSYQYMYGVFLSQFAYTTALIMKMETINPEISVMDTFHAVVMFYRTGTVHQLLCGTILRWLTTP